MVVDVATVSVGADDVGVFALRKRSANSTPMRLASSAVTSPGLKDWRTW